MSAILDIKMAVAPPESVFLTTARARLGGSHGYACDLTMLRLRCTLEPRFNPAIGSTSNRHTGTTEIASGNRELISEGHLISPEYLY